MSKHFNNSNILRILYCQLVRPILEYGSIIWSPYYITHSYDTEKVQHKFLRLAANHCGHPKPFDCHNYDSILDRMNLSTLSKRRMIADIILVCKTAHDLINCSDIVNIFSLNVPMKNLRSRELLHILPHNTSYSYYSSFNRMFSNLKPALIDTKPVPEPIQGSGIETDIDGKILAKPTQQTYGTIITTVGLQGLEIGITVAIF
ncbi:hypothetical protein M0802_012585 [Mischocyttarus mexicanus]|nr:hypothetical protein M0802_012585 [Mischocyttarus mexicanus]